MGKSVLERFFNSRFVGDGKAFIPKILLEEEDPACLLPKKYLYPLCRNMCRSLNDEAMLYLYDPQSEEIWLIGEAKRRADGGYDLVGFYRATEDGEPEKVTVTEEELKERGVRRCLLTGTIFRVRAGLNMSVPQATGVAV